MSALPSIADVCSATSDVRFVPIADMPASNLDVRFTPDSGHSVALSSLRASCQKRRKADIPERQGPNFSDCARDNCEELRPPQPFKDRFSHHPALVLFG